MYHKSLRDAIRYTRNLVSLLLQDILTDLEGYPLDWFDKQSIQKTLAIYEPVNELEYE